MIRFFTEYLLNWKNRTDRKPMIVRGARQVGKTHIIEEFGNVHFDNIIKVNFEEEPALKQFFNTNNVIQIQQQLEVFYGIQISPSKTLLFLDEIQACPEAIVTLRYFYEKNPALHVIAAGSLLDHTLNEIKYSMPVGRVEFAYMYPMCFYEFLIAVNEKQLVDFLQKYNLDTQIPLPIHEKLLRLVKEYFFVGGMPEIVKNYVENKSFLNIERIKESIVRSLEFDFSKYGTRSQQLVLTKLLKYLPKTTGKKFKYVNFDESIRSDQTKIAIDLLKMSRIVHLIHNTKAIGIPLENDSNEKIFKTVFFDIGLSNHLLKIRLTDIENIILSNEGNIAEQFVAQELICKPPYYIESSLFYWLRENRNSEAEIDYLTEYGNRIVPIEVKAGKIGTLKSLQIFVTEKGIDKVIRFNADLPSSLQVKTSIKYSNRLNEVDFKLISLPIYMVWEFERFLQV
jgi:uncharacterized protein